MSWFLCKVEDGILMVEEGETQPGRVTTIMPGPNVCLLKVLTTEGASRLVKIERFLLDKNPLCARFKKAVEKDSRSIFCKLFKKVFSEGIEDSSTDTSSGTDKSSPDATSSPNSPQLQHTSGLQRQLEEKTVGGCVAVHLDNLFGPRHEHQTRALDMKHIQELKESFSKNPEQLVVLYGVVEDNYKAEQLITSGGAKVYVIRGNHTRVALQSLFESSIWGQETVQMKIFQDLSREEALSLGVHHNTVHTLGKPMSFLEKVHLIRELGGNSRMTKKEKMDFYSRLMKVFDYETTTKARNNLKNHLALSRCSREVWGLVQAVGDAWNRKAITGQPRKKLIEQTFFKKLVKASEETITVSLKTLLKEGYKAYLKTLKNRDSDESEPSDESEHHNEDMDEQIIDDEDGNSNETDSEKVLSQQELQEENRLLREEIELLRIENQTLKMTVQHLESTQQESTSVMKEQSARGTKRNHESTQQESTSVMKEQSARGTKRNHESTQQESTSVMKEQSARGTKRNHESTQQESTSVMKEQSARGTKRNHESTQQESTSVMKEQSARGTKRNHESTQQESTSVLKEQSARGTKRNHESTQQESTSVMKEQSARGTKRKGSDKVYEVGHYGKIKIQSLQAGIQLQSDPFVEMGTTWCPSMIL